VSSTDPGHRPRLATVGDNCIDVLRYADGRVVRRLGGNAVNVAVQAVRAGAEVEYFGAVGDDVNGQFTLSVLAAQGVDIDGAVVRSAPTSVTEIDVRPDGERILAREDFGACRGYVPLPSDLERILRADHVHIGWLDDGGALRRALAQRGRPVSQDLSVNAHSRDLGVEGLTIAFGSLAGPPAPAEALARDWLARGVAVAVVTRGPEGATVVTREGVWHVPAEPVEPVDTTGAGDSFIAAFLLARLGGAAPEQAARAGVRAARLTCLHEGGFPQDDAPE
jgi:fructoselysine 6-kinase